MGQFEPTLNLLPFSQMLFFNFLGIFLGCLPLDIKCLYVTMAQEVHRSHLSAFQWNILANVFVSVDMITVQSLIYFCCYHCLLGVQGQKAKNTKSFNVHWGTRKKIRNKGVEYPGLGLFPHFQKINFKKIKKKTSCVQDTFQAILSHL